ncbi:putative polyketide synthase [Tricladium varicosporioides]|nr:putative polyketide synthase [Hymenoscyphus varicosporioides]
MSFNGSREQCPSKGPNGVSNTNLNDIPGTSSVHHENDAIAVIGFSLRFPQEATSPESFWNMLMASKSARTKVPKERYNVDAFYHPGGNKAGMLNVQHGHFIKDDIAGFDAPFFSLQANEVACMDPSQRWLLETTYEALENAGITLSQASESNTSVFIGSFLQDYDSVLNKDPQIPRSYRAPGIALSMLSNRISWFYNLHGPSMTVDTACSSSLIAFHLACQSIRSGESEIGIVGGCNLIYSPESSMALGDMNFLSPDGISYSFDTRANGYARGEGFGIIILKQLDKALQDGDNIRAVVRATGTNQDGHTPGITQPSGKAQEDMIRQLYANAGLDMGLTAFVEAHGTGTSLGDPIEANAIGNAFKDSRLSEIPLYLGAVKSNIGHLEGASGVAGLIKTIMALEKAIIPPNIWFNETNPEISTKELNIKFPTEPIPWPTKGLRRASVNSFGFGGSNSHAVLDDAYNFLRDKHLSGKHITQRVPPTAEALKQICFKEGNVNATGHHSELQVESTKSEEGTNKLFVLSASDEKSLKRLTRIYQNFISTSKDSTRLEDLAYTLSEKRTYFPWRFSVVADSAVQLKKELGSGNFGLVRAMQTLKLCFIFTGQGAQWYAMGRELLVYPTFKQSLRTSEIYFQDLGCKWSLTEELLKEETISKLNDAEYSQPICTALQIALVQLLLAWNVQPVAVIGHSSGEIAAAYCIGALSQKSACKVAYYRGIVAASLLESQMPGAMLAVGLSEKEMTEYFHRDYFTNSQLAISCFNSPRNITVSGNEAHIHLLQLALEKDDVFVKRLPGKIAYHSLQMGGVKEDYRLLIHGLDSGLPLSNNVVMFSSLTGCRVTTNELCTPEYWVKNMISPVKFTQAVGNMYFQQSKKLGKSIGRHANDLAINHVIEIGPHSALKSALRDIFVTKSSEGLFSYCSILVRGKSARSTAMQCAGQLWCLGYPVKINLVNDYAQTPSCRRILVNLPAYPFDHSKKYWLESRISKGYRFRKHHHHQLLGTQVDDWNPLEARWRNIIRLRDSPWIKDHIVNEATIYPGAGMLVMAIEAAKQLSEADSIIKTYHLKDVTFRKALVIPGGDAGIEVQVYLRSDREKLSHFLIWNPFRICVFEDNEWSTICDGSIAIEYCGDENALNNSTVALEAALASKQHYDINSHKCTHPMGHTEFYNQLKDCGLRLGPNFQSLTNIRYNEHGEATGTVNLDRWGNQHFVDEESPHVIHPTALDPFLQLMFAALSKETVTTMVPVSFRSLWISACIGSTKASDSGIGPLVNESRNVSAYANAKIRGLRSAEASFLGLDEKTGAPLLAGDFALASVAESSAIQSTNSNCPRPLCYNINWKPDLAMMDTKEVFAYCSNIPQSPLPYQDLEDDKSLFTLAHKSPDMKILEIGAGTGATTSKILQSLSNFRPDDHKGEKDKVFMFDEYTFTDISASFFEKAKIRFHYCESKMTFRTLDIENSPEAQGLKVESYDMIIAASYVPTNFFLSIQHSQIIGTEANRKWGPTIATTSWNSYLFTSGFTGLDMTFSDKNDPRSHSAMISTTKETVTSPIQPPRAAIIVSRGSPFQEDCAAHLRNLFKGSFSKCDIISLTDIGSTHSDYSVWICLLEVRQSLLYQISEQELRNLQRIFQFAEAIIWVNSKPPNSDNPVNSMATGLTRSLRSENSLTKIVTLQLENLHSHTQFFNKIFRVTKRVLQSPLDSYEQEYLEIDGELCISRMVMSQYLNEFVTGKTKSKAPQPQRFGEDPSRDLKLTMAHPGMLDSFQYEDDSDFATTEIGSDELEVEIKAVGLNFRDILIALGQEHGTSLGLEFSGIVTKVGDNASNNFSPGDRLCGLSDGCLRNRARCNTCAVVKIPSGISFETAAAIPIVYSTAYYALVHLARLKPKESVLIHSAAGGFGQACIQISKLLGAKIFATVGNEDKKKFLISTYGISENNIFSSRTPEFALGIKARTKGYGVDVVVNSLAGEALKCSWECIAPFGRFIEAGKKDTHGFGSLPMIPFSRHASFSTVDLYYIFLNAPELLKDLLESSIGLLVKDEITAPTPLHVYDGPKIEEAFRYLESGKSVGKIVIKLQDDDIVPVSDILCLLSISPLTCYSFDPNATYVIAGGLGGIGRCIARWMVKNSAKHLILLSRSTSHSKAATGLLQELRTKGVQVSTPICNVADANSLQDALYSCNSMPSIRGCIQASMVLQDAQFSNMTIDDFNAAIRPKVQGSWNLHSLLPPGMDFFILLSSIAGIIGSYGQSNYSAGNSYQDALAIHRTSIGEKAISFDLGVIQQVGYVAEAENPEQIKGTKQFRPVTENELLSLLEYACDPYLPIQSALRTQVVVGIDTPATKKARRENEPFWMCRPLFRHLNQISNAQDSQAGLLNTNTDIGYQEMIAAATSIAEVTEIIITGVQAKLSRTLGAEAENIDAGKPMHTYGVDSLFAVEVRTWFRNIIGIDITVFDILGNKSIAELVGVVAPKSRFITESLRIAHDLANMSHSSS